MTEARHGEGLPAPAADAQAGLLGLAGEQVEVERFAYEATRDIAGSDTALPGEPLGRALTPWLSSAGGKVRAARGADGSRILLTHDAQGRVTERRMERNGFRPKVWSYGWNALDRLVSCETPEGERWAYGYDPFGRRLWKRRGTSGPSGGSGVGVIRSEARIGEAFLWDGDVVADAAPLYADGAIAWDKAVSWHHEPGTFRPIARQDAQIVHHVVTDHLGTPRELYDAVGQRAWSRSHRLWGETRGLVPAYDEAVSLATARTAHASATLTDRETNDLCPIGFPGQWADSESGLAYNRFRYYDASSGHYVSPDPIGIEGGSRPQRYVHTPTINIDPLGLDDFPYGPFHRLRSPTQSDATATLQAQSSEIWGSYPRGGNWPTVQAYRGSLPEGEPGVEFYTKVPPQSGQNPAMPAWYQGNEGVSDRTIGDKDFASIEAKVTKNTQTGVLPKPKTTGKNGK